MPAKLGDRDDLGVAMSLLRWIGGLPPEDRAAASGVKLKSIKSIEQGRRGATPKTLGPLLASLGFSLEALAEVLSFIRRLRGAAALPQRSPGKAAPPLAGCLLSPRGWRGPAALPQRSPGKAAPPSPATSALAGVDLRRQLLA